MMTSVSGYPVWQATFEPFGIEYNPQMTVNHYKFAGLERDAESDLDHTWFRQYSSTVDRWMTPDPLGGDITNPQSLNRYAYVMNNPTTLTDPSGLSSLQPCQSEFDCPPGPGCLPDIDPFCMPSPPVWPIPPGAGGGAGGGGGGTGGTGGTSSTAGSQPWPGNAGFPNGSNVCTVIFVPGVGPQISCTITNFPPTGGIVADAMASLGAALAGLLHSSWVTMSMTGAVPLGTEAVGLGPTVQSELNLSTGQVCGGVGVALSFPAFPGRAINFGTLIHGNLANASNILPGSGFSGSVQATPSLGYQAIWNSSGVVGGPTVGVPGAQVAYQFGKLSGCGNLYSSLGSIF